MESFRPKTAPEKTKDIKDVESILDQPLTHEDMDADLSLEEIKRRYPERYRIFLETLRLTRNLPDHTFEMLEDLKHKAVWLNTLRSVLESEEEREKLGLHPRQIRVLDKTLLALEAGITKGHITFPTGSGKTVIFSKLIQTMCKNKNAKVLVVAPTKIILEQNQGKVETFGDVDVGAYYGREKDLSQQVTVTTYNSFMGSEDLDLESYDLIILDEAHRALSPARIETINALKKPAVIGVTATPEFHEAKKIEDILDYEIDSMNIREGVMEGLLSSVKVYVVNTNTEIEGVERAGKDYDENALHSHIDTKERNELVVSTYLNSKELNGCQAVAYCITQDHARRMAKAFKERGIAAAYIGGDLNDYQIEKILTDYRNKKIKVLCNANILIEGFDEEDAEVCLNARPTLSKVVAEQRGGRTARRSKRNPRKIAKVIEFVDTWKEDAEMPVLFSEVAGAAEILGPAVTDAPEEETGKAGPAEEEEKMIKASKDSKLRSPGQEGPDLLQSDPELVMTITRKFKAHRQESRFRPAPEGWAHTRMLSQETGVQERRIQKFADGYRLDHPKWFKNSLTATNRLCEHYAPELVGIIRREFLPDLRNMVNIREFAESQHIKESYTGSLFSLVVEERKDIPVIMVGGEVYLDREQFKEWYERKRQAEAKRQERAQKRALDKYLDTEKEPEAEKEYYEEIDTSPSFELSGDEPDNTVPISDEDAVSQKEKNAFRDIAEEDFVIPSPETRDFIGLLPQALASLDERYQRVLINRFFKDMTLEEAGDDLGVTRERVRQMETKALRMLGHPSYMLNEYEDKKERIDGIQLSRRHINEIHTYLDHKSKNSSGERVTSIKDLIASAERINSLLTKNGSHIEEMSSATIKLAEKLVQAIYYNYKVKKLSELYNEMSGVIKFLEAALDFKSPQFGEYYELMETRQDHLEELDTFIEQKEKDILTYKIPKNPSYSERELLINTEIKKDYLQKIKAQWLLIYKKLANDKDFAADNLFSIQNLKTEPFWWHNPDELKGYLNQLVKLLV